MGRRDWLKGRFSRVFGSGANSPVDTTDSNGQQLYGLQENTEPNKPPEEEGLNESPETLKSRRIEDIPIRELWDVAYEKLREQDGALIADYEAKLTGSVTAGLGQAFNLKQNRREWMQAVFESKMQEFNKDISKPKSGNYKVQAEDAMRLILRIANSADDYISNTASANPSAEQTSLVKGSALRHGLDAVKWKDWSSLVEEIHEQERNFAAVEEMWRDIQRYEKHLTTIITFSEMNAKLSALADQDFAGLLRWLCDVDPSPMYNTGLDRREAGTCEWLIKDSEEFKTWETSDGSLLWLHGKAGSGKSILSSSVIKRLRDQYISEPSTVVSYFYFSFSDPEKQKVDVMLASLTKQICSQQTQRSQLTERLGQYKINGQRPDTETLEAMLIASASQFANVYIVIDALDECPLLNEQRAKLLKSLRRILAIAPSKFHFFFTSRKEPDIDDKIRPILSLTDKNEIDLLARQQIINKDIIHYVDSQLNGDEYKSWPKSVKDEARKSLVKKADCMFQYVHLQLEALRHLSSEPEVREALQNLPIGLDATYNRVLESIPLHFQERVIHSLKWLAFSRRSLCIEELAEIFTIRPHNDIPFNERERPFSPTDILKYFSGLIMTREGYTSQNPKGIVIRLVHFSLKEYLVSKRITQGSTSTFSFTEVDAHNSIVKSCLAYLNHFGHWVASHPPGYLFHDTYNQLYPLAMCAARSWMDHLEGIPRVSWSPDIERDAATALAVHSQSLLTLLAMDYRADNDERDMLLRPYRYTAKCGHYQLTEMLVHQKSGANKYVTREEMDESLQQMAYEKNKDAMQFFLKAGANVNAQCGERGSALKAAASRGSLDAGRFLHSYGSKFNLYPNNDRDPFLPTWMDKKGTESLRFLLDSGADVNMQVKPSGTALHNAVIYSYDADFDLLLERGADVNALSDYGTPLQALSRYVKKLLESGADPNLRSGEGDTALQLVCGNIGLFPNHQVAMEIIQSLVKNETVESGTLINGFAVEVEEYHLDRRDLGWKWRKGERPIVRSAVEVVKLLLEKGAKVDESRVFQEACVERDEERVRWMFDQGAADVNMKSGSRGTPLHAVLAYTRKDIGEARSDRRDLSSRNSLSKETLPIVQLLISKGAQVNQVGGHYGNALQAACSNEGLSANIVHYLLEQKADVNAEGGKCGTALITACAADQEVDLVRLLLEHGADVYAEGGEYGTALATACKRGAPELVRLLLEHGANIHQKDYAAWNAAGGRSMYRDDGIQVLELLFGQANDVDGVRSGLATALNATLEIWNIGSTFGHQEKGWHERFSWLLEHGADANVKAGKYGCTLQTACARESSTAYVNDINATSLLTKLLLEKCPNINVNAQGGIFGSALQAAAFSGQTESVRMLLDRGADVNARGGKCGSALNAAIFSGYWDIVEILLQKGATPDCRLLQQPDEEWLQRVGEEWPEDETRSWWRKRVREEYRHCAVARYRKFWEVESGSAAGRVSSSQS
ncbi:uncharacterized protein Triagg1_6347 [Trichoderma aggressivum f. europaeum]|uniref:Nephrocystin 3-like N-terminal domain-containing protein n=1 Tax=Trichoderma aggressivum f. europaeum TaxID=173218 RepID=A0AAE1IDP3_9HYPO|nr:hypothetical protein Triagg1_6347 [Trichoderma aggressivum f. europaeum]